MIPLLLSILSSSVLMVIFKYFTRFEVKTFQAITVNYFVAATLGFVLSPIHFEPLLMIEANWFASALIIGCVFIAMFYIMAVSSQTVGVAITSVANKMSLVIPVVAGVILYQESLAGFKLIGVITALVAVALVTYPNTKLKIEKKHLILPLIIFLGSGFLDTIFKFVETHQIKSDEIEMFSASLFLMAALVGSSVLLYSRIVHKSTLETKSIVAGFALGIPNYFSIHFLLMTLNLPNMESTLVFPINNTGIVLLSTLLAIVLFSEKLTKLNWSGIALAILSIALIATA
ncbi:MAG: EamA/RhaT family transporter [Flavobacteriales bacterium]|nr:EamA/RhaT family transporter [Flavobacteriales bacterium]MCB9191352.1 EamA/RhaT family transporter [Flavobacteriales bacterium]MCB9204022.1 EamA/RhaT family transporter [Flavobacteriales bacterium]